MKTPKTNGKSKSANNLEELKQSAKKEFLDVNKIYCLNSKTKTLKDLYNELIYEDDEEEDQE